MAADQAFGPSETESSAIVSHEPHRWILLADRRSADRQTVQQLVTDAMENANTASAAFQTQIAGLRMQLDNSEAEARNAKEMAK